jgi:hypothetical protein
MLYFKDQNNTNCAVMVFAPYRYTVDSLDGMKSETTGAERKKQSSLIRLVTTTNGKRKIKYYHYLVEDSKYLPVKH